MTLSICIPIYNYNITRLVHDLDRQASSLGLTYEIFVIDDGSSQFKEENRVIADLPNVRYQELSKNIGRAAIRNQLAREALYDHLLFMDCDTEIIDDHFIERYTQHPDSDVVVGGYGYKQEVPPVNKRLRWIYGTHREEKAATIRNQNPFQSFSTFNFMIKKELFSHVSFDESLNGYGHEDTLFGWNLKQTGCTLLHIDNPMYHLAYEEAVSFVQKSENSIYNLWNIYQQIDKKEEFCNDVKILRHYERLNRLHLSKAVHTILSTFHQLIHKNLLSAHPSLLLYDLYRLELLIEIGNKAKQ